MALNKQIKALREEVLKISQQEFALGLGVHRRTVQGWEYGNFEPFGASRKYLDHLATCKDAQAEFTLFAKDALKRFLRSREK